MDILDKLVSLAQIKGRVDVQCRFQENWYVRQEPVQTQGQVHIVAEGEGYLKVDGCDARFLEAGDVVLFPRIAGHVISSSAACDNIGDVPEVVQNGVFTLKKSGSTGRGMDLFCACFDYDAQADLIRSLPEVVYLKVEHPSLRALIGMLEYEAERKEEGAGTVINALFSVLLVLLMRVYLEQGNREALAGTLNGWQDNRLRGVVQAVLESPEHTWSVSDMAATANMSRAQLMRLFKQQIGVSPHVFVNRIRLQQAALLLKNTADSVLSVGLSVGFRSETHFGKAFKKQYGMSPGQYRKSDKADLNGTPE